MIWLYLCFNFIPVMILVLKIKNKEYEDPKLFVYILLWLIVWCVGGVIAFSICSFVAEALRPIIGGFFTGVVVVVLFFGLLILLAGIVPYPGSLEPGRPRFFGDPG